MPLATREFSGSCFEHGTAYVTADFSGAALWLPPGAQPDGEAVERVFRDTAKREHLDDLLATLRRWISRTRENRIGTCLRSALSRTLREKASGRR